MRIFGLQQDSIVDGPGFRFACFVQGCPHGCPGCHNPDSHDPAGGQEMSVEEVARQLLKNPLTDGLTLSGGEPFAQAEDCLALAKIAHGHGLNVWSYSGWTFEYLRDQGTPEQKALLAELDVLVDGPFLLSERTLALPWRGSRNQRVVDVRRSLETGTVAVRPD
ncbi:MAG: anaerobic ribonucleoside-triphosphate reductase activating protein [Oscillospiraceae bacterium]|jgi:anaerobic ribonucleoside-triphosphate reductase activating protein|nr:anaerobic ribonucleoside-triphosphate reductase activating protein [Oscillospiraceae bacterium]